MKFRGREFEEKLFELKDSRDSIVSTSAWALNFPEQHAEMASLWLVVFKKVNPNHQISLFYLANDVIQNSRKQSLNFSSSFLPAIKEALTLVRHVKAKVKLSRVLKVWDERRIFQRDDILGMMRTLSGDVVDSKLVENFQPSELFVRLRMCDQLQDVSDESMRTIQKKELKSLSNVQEVRVALKDKPSAEELAEQLESMYDKLKTAVENLEKENKERVKLLEILTVAEAHYDNENREAKKVANAYKCFGSKVKIVKKGLDEKLKQLPLEEDSSFTTSLNTTLSFEHDEMAKSLMKASGLFEKMPLQNNFEINADSEVLTKPSTSERVVPPLKPPPTPHSDLLQQLPDSTTEDLFSPQSPPTFERAPTTMIAPKLCHYYGANSRDVDMRQLDFQGNWGFWNNGNVNSDQ